MTNETTTLLKAPDDGESSENVVDPSYTLASMDEPEEPPETQTVDKLVADYILLRDELKIMQQEHTAAEENVKEALARILCESVKSPTYRRLTASRYVA